MEFGLAIKSIGDCFMYTAKEFKKKVTLTFKYSFCTDLTKVSKYLF